MPRQALPFPIALPLGLQGLGIGNLCNIGGQNPADLVRYILAGRVRSDRAC